MGIGESYSFGTGEETFLQSNENLNNPTKLTLDQQAKMSKLMEGQRNKVTGWALGYLQNGMMGKFFGGNQNWNVDIIYPFIIWNVILLNPIVNDKSMITVIAEKNYRVGCDVNFRIILILFRLKW